MARASSWQRFLLAPCWIGACLPPPGQVEPPEPVDDPCAGVACTTLRACGEACPAACGCCDCTPAADACTLEAGAAVAYVCDIDRGCLKRTACADRQTCEAEPTPTCRDIVDPCDDVACTEAPACDTTCSASCGCCACDVAQETCAYEDGQPVIYRCSADASCLERTACPETEACRAAPEVACVPGFFVGGTASGLVGTARLELYEIRGWHYYPITLHTIDADGPFVIPAPLADGAQYEVTTLSTARQICEPLFFEGTINGADANDLAISCRPQSPCEQASNGCWEGHPDCVMAGFHAVSVALSCAPDGSPTPDTGCCLVPE